MMDYKLIMEKDERTFPEFYEEVMNNLSNYYLLDNKLQKLLKEKREFGLKKYGELSFQSNFENAVKTPSVEHLKEELVDAFNYFLHTVYQRKLLGKEPDKTLDDVLRGINQAWVAINLIIP